MTDEPAFSRREGDQLARRLESIDRDGTRGMQMLSQQTQNNTAELAALRADLANRFDQHTAQHAQEMAALVARRRYRTTTGVAVWAALIASLALLAYIAATVRGIHS